MSREALALPESTGPLRRAVLCVALVAVGVCLTGPDAFAAPGDIPKPPGANPDNRGWEKVSPADKNGEDIYYGDGLTRTSPDGNRAVFTAPRAFGEEAAGSPKTSDYLAVRTPSGWTTRNITPAMDVDLLGGQVAIFWGFRAFSADLTRGAYVTTDPGQERNAYYSDLVGGSTTRITPPPLTPMADPMSRLFSQVRIAGGSKDLERLFFESPERLTADSPDPAGGRNSLLGSDRNVYEWSDGGLRLVSVLPDGSPAPQAVLGGGAGIDEVDQRRSASDAISSDGSRVYFTVPTSPDTPQDLAGTPGEIYLRTGTTTLHVSESQRTDCAGDPTCGGDGEPDPAPDPDGPGKVSFLAASGDGSVAALSSCRKLTDDSQASCEAKRPETYLYDLATKELTSLNLASSFPDDWSLPIGFSDDGSYYYFTLKPSGDARRTAMVWHEGSIEAIGDSGTTEEGDERNEERFWLGARTSRVSADGRYLLWVTEAEIDGAQTGGHKQVFLYDAQTGDIDCVSCRSDGLPTKSRGRLAEVRPSPLTTGLYNARMMDEAGTRVFFNTAEPLVPGDTNGKHDAYQYDIATGEHSLISSGKGNTDAWVVDSTPDGSSVFFVTAQALVATDLDQQRDLYVAREGGGFPDPELTRPPCEGDACQASVAALPSRLSPATANVRGTSTRRRPPTALALRPVGPGALRTVVQNGRLPVRVSANRAGRIRVVVRAKGRPGIVGKASKFLKRPGVVKLVVPLARSVRERLADGKQVRISINVKLAGVERSRTLILGRKESN